MTARTLLLGDWNRWVRDPIDVLRLSLLAGAVGFAIAGDAFGAVLMAGAAVVAWAVRLVNLPRVYDLAFMLAISLQAWGEALGAYESFPSFDVIAHFSLPFFFAPTLYILLARLDLVPDPKDETHTRHYVGMFAVAFAFGAGLGAVWELWEWLSDHTLGSELQLGNDDTVGDLAADTAGSLCGAALLVAWARYGWGSVRRVPGVNVREDTEA